MGFFGGLTQSGNLLSLVEEVAGFGTHTPVNCVAATERAMGLFLDWSSLIGSVRITGSWKPFLYLTIFSPLNREVQ